MNGYNSTFRSLTSDERRKLNVQKVKKLRALAPKCGKKISFPEGRERGE
jgi:hypothetical protein